MKNKKNRLNNLLKFGVFLFGISLLLWNCKLEEPQEIEQQSLLTIFSNRFNPDAFKEILPHQFLVDWSNPKKQYSEQLKNFFYEFPISYKNPDFNPKVLNKLSRRKYYRKYKIIVIEKGKNQYEYFLAKFYQEKNRGIPNLIDSEVTLRQDFGYDGITHLFNENLEKVFAKRITLKKQENVSFSVNFTPKNNTEQQRCRTITTLHYRDWWQNVYDSYGNYLGVIYLGSTYVGSTTREECGPIIEPDYVNAEVICQGTCIEAVTDVLLCPNGDPADANGNCEGYGENLGVGDSLTPEQLMKLQRIFLLTELPIVRGSDEMTWVNDAMNNQAVSQIYNYLQSYSIDGIIPQNILEFAFQVISNWVTNPNAEVDYDDKIINNLTGKADCAYNKLISSGISNYHNMITDLFIEFGTNNIGGRVLTFEMSTILGVNEGGRTQINVNTGDYRILINSNLINTLSSIEIAAILIHEIAHAFLGKHYNNSSASFNELYEQYINDTGIANYSHDIMRDQFINRMAIVLQNYDNTIFSSFDNYKTLASQGVFILTQAQQSNLSDVKQIARNNDTNCN